jgi:hypothetical protein
VFSVFKILIQASTGIQAQSLPNDILPFTIMWGKFVIIAARRIPKTKVFDAFIWIQLMKLLIAAIGHAVEI